VEPCRLEVEEQQRRADRRAGDQRYARRRVAQPLREAADAGVAVAPGGGRAAVDGKTDRFPVWAEFPTELRVREERHGGAIERAAAGHRIQTMGGNRPGAVTAFIVNGGSASARSARRPVIGLARLLVPD